MTRVADFTPAKVNEVQAGLLKAIAEGYSIFAEALIEALPANDHRALALDKLLESKFQASQAVSHNPETTEHLFGEPQ